MKDWKESAVKKRYSKYQIGMRIIVLALLVFFAFFGFWVEVRAEESDISLYCNGKLSTEYHLHHESLHYNKPATENPENGPVIEGSGELSHYSLLDVNAPLDSKTGEPYLSQCYGLIYSGEIHRSVPQSDGSLAGTVLCPADGADCVFSVRLKKAIEDKWERQYDLILKFTRITFLSDAELSGPVRLMHGYRLHASTNLVDDGGAYLLRSAGSEDFHLRIRYEYDYSIEDAEGNPAEGTLLFDVANADKEILPEQRRLIGPKGTLETEVRADGRRSEELWLFSSTRTHNIMQTGSDGGVVAAIRQDAGGDAAESTDKRIILPQGERSEHLVRPDPGYVIASVRIDGQDLGWDRIVWTGQPDGIETAEVTILEHYGSGSSAGYYLLTRSADGSVRLVFEDIRDNHRIDVRFVRRWMSWLKRSVMTGRNRKLRKICLIAMLLSGAVFSGAVLFMIAAERREQKTRANREI